MRLICPNCSAQYVVDDSVIPETGRDVQCSACGHTWFQPSRAMLDATAEAEREAAESPSGWDIPEATPEPEFEAEYEAEAAQPLPQMAPPPATDETPDDGALSQAIASMMAEAPPAKPAPDAAPRPSEPAPLSAAPAAGTVQRRALDDSLLSILREEAEREAAARRAEGGTIETQEEMNLEPDLASAAASRAAAKLAAAARPSGNAARSTPDFSDLNDDFAADEDDRVADLTEGSEEEPARVSTGAARRPALPDIEEINSSLRASADRAGEAAAYGTPQHRAEQRSGFRLGFFSVLALAALAAALYLLAPRLSASVPALSPLLDTYVAWVNEGRAWLDAQLRAVIARFAQPKG